MDLFADLTDDELLAVKVIRDKLKMLDANDRAELIYELSNGYCAKCGDESDGCCWCDCDD